MLRRLQTEETPTGPLGATSDELAQAVELLRRDREEQSRREQETAALAAAMKELGLDVTAGDLAQAIQVVRGRRTRARLTARRRRWGLAALSTMSLALFAFLLLVRSERLVAEAQASAAAAAVAPGVTYYDLDNRVDVLFPGRNGSVLRYRSLGNGVYELR